MIAKEACFFLCFVCVCTMNVHAREQFPQSLGDSFSFPRPQEIKQSNVLGGST